MHTCTKFNTVLNLIKPICFFVSKYLLPVDFKLTGPSKEVYHDPKKLIVVVSYTWSPGEGGRGQALLIMADTGRL